MATTQNGANNAFIKLQKSANGRVSVKLQKNHFAKNGENNFFGKVERYTHSTQNILDAMSESLPLVDLGTVTCVLNAYANTVLKSLSSGNAVKFGELGTFYIAGKGTVEGEGEKPCLTVKFSPTKILRDAVQNVEITDSSFFECNGEIVSVTDVTTGKSDRRLTACGSVLLEGSGLKVGGESSGIWFAPVSENGTVSEDESAWTKAESSLVYNMPSKLLFALPATLTVNGNYKIVVRTRYAGKAGYERKYLMEARSDIVTLSA